jgi:ribosomal protein S8
MFFVNIPGQDSKDYWPDDVIGRVGYISTLDQGFKNERQYKLHKYLASCLRKKISFNVMTLLEQSGLINDYKLGNKKSALTKLQSYLDGFYNYGTLIKNKPIKIPSKSDIEGKYELERI